MFAELPCVVLDCPWGLDLYRGSTGTEACSTPAPGMRPGTLTPLFPGSKIPCVWI